MWSQIGELLRQTMEFVFIYPALLRFWLQVVRAPIGNPLSQLANALTDFAVKPLRRFVPGLYGYDLASLVWAFVAEFLLLLVFWGFLSGLLLGGGIQAVPALLLVTFVKLIRLTLYLMMFAVIAQAIMSWISPYHPLYKAFNALTRGLLEPVQRVVPQLSGIDLSPIVVLVAIQIVLIALVGPVETSVLRLFTLAG